jgi:hypothetical protein
VKLRCQQQVAPFAADICWCHDALVDDMSWKALFLPHFAMKAALCASSGFDSLHAQHPQWHPAAGSICAGLGCDYLGEGLEFVKWWA